MVQHASFHEDGGRLAEGVPGPALAGRLRHACKHVQVAVEIGLGKGRSGMVKSSLATFDVRMPLNDWVVLRTML
jgi:hypothetical protein